MSHVILSSVEGNVILSSVEGNVILSSVEGNVILSSVEGNVILSSVEGRRTHAQGDADARVCGILRLRDAVIVVELRFVAHH